MDLFKNQAEMMDRFYEKCHTEKQYIANPFGKDPVEKKIKHRKRFQSDEQHL